MINLMVEKLHPATLARYLLEMASIPPCPDADQGDQYEITGFGIDIRGIYITNHGKTHCLTLKRKRQ